MCALKGRSLHPEVRRQMDLCSELQPHLLSCPDVFQHSKRPTGQFQLQARLSAFRRRRVHAATVLPVHITLSVLQVSSCWQIGANPDWEESEKEENWWTVFCMKVSIEHLGLHLVLLHYLFSLTATDCFPYMESKLRSYWSAVLDKNLLTWR